MKLNQFGVRAGGPIMIPGLADGRNKAFFFALRADPLPEQPSRRTVFNPRVYDGWFRYQFGSEVREVNLLSWRRAMGRSPPWTRPCMSLQAKIDAATKTTGTRSANSDPLYDNYVWQSPSELFEHQPTVRARLQPHRQPPAERLVVHDHRQADAGLPEQRRSAVSGRAEPARLRLHGRCWPWPCGR